MTNDEVMIVPQSHWREVCRKLAQERAEEEARNTWKVHQEQTPPFSHRWEHVQEVVRLALWLAGRTAADCEVVEAASWLHDICKEQKQHALQGAIEAGRLLPATDFPPGKIAAVVDAIRQHEGMYRPAGAAPIQPIEAAVLWDADKLSKVGVQALAFILSANYLAGLTLAERRRNILDYAYKTLARTVTSMNTAPAQRLAKQRYEQMLAVLDVWGLEEAMEMVDG
jgi:HD superfamily phosphodiesterase